MAITEEQGRFIEQTFNDMQKKLHTYAVSVLKDDFQAEEAVQETFCVVCKKPEDMLTSPNPPGWVMEALKNELKNTERRNATLRKYFIAAKDADMKWTRDSFRQIDDDVDLMYVDLIRKEDFYLLKQVILEKRTLLNMAEESRRYQCYHSTAMKEDRRVKHFVGRGCGREVGLQRRRSTDVHKRAGRTSAQRICATVICI